MPHVDETLSILSAPRRRHVVRALAEGPTDVRSLSDRITAAERDLALDAVDYDAQQGTHTALVQVHLPKLSEHEVAVWDRESGYVARGRHFPVYRDALHALAAVEGVEVTDEPLPD